MPVSTRHTSIRPPRCVIAAVMTVLYLCISLAPLFASALKSKTALHALTGQCVGDCDICGCSAESRASGTCCCSRSSVRKALTQQDDSLPECCRKAPLEKEPVVLSCGCPCNDDRSVLVSGAKSGELLPFYFSASLAPPSLAFHYLDSTRPLRSRDEAPPAPPPRRA